MPRTRHQAQCGQRHGMRWHGAADPAHLRTPGIDLLVDTDLAKHTVGQGAVNAHDRARLIRRNQAHGPGGTNQKVPCVDARTAMSPGLHQPMPGQRPGSDPNTALERLARNNVHRKPASASVQTLSPSISTGQVRSGLVQGMAQASPVLTLKRPK
ncbi:hypothetical protein D3C84_864570 [compost metagenome]